MSGSVESSCSLFLCHTVLREFMIFKFLLSKCFLGIMQHIKDTRMRSLSVRSRMQKFRCKYCTTLSPVCVVALGSHRERSSLHVTFHEVC